MERPNYPQPYNIKMPKGMTDKQIKYYQLKEHGRLKREQMELIKSRREYENE